MKNKKKISDTVAWIAIILGLIAIVLIILKVLGAI